MNRKEIKILEERIAADFLPLVRRPSRYIGGEVNQIKKDLAKCELTVALCFPDVYEIAMSNTGLAVIYDILNNIEGIAAERVFSLWDDAEKILRAAQIPLFSLESKADVGSFDIVGFSLTNELCYSNLLNMLDLAGLSVRGKDRGENDPLIVAGGSMANCCEPIAEFVDVFVLGDGEEAIVELVELIRAEKANGTKKCDILLKIAKKFNWAYVPRFYEFKYESGQITGFAATVDGLATKFENAVVKDFENAPVPLRPIVGFTQAVHERVSVEIMRGCPRRCLFCQVSFCRRPVRYRSPEKIVQIAKAAYEATGFDTISLLSLSTADYPKLEELTLQLQGHFQKKHVGLSLPSLRVDQQLELFPKLVTSVRKGGLTIAVEAASQRLRETINKPLKNEDLFAAVEAAYQAGWQRVKLYFMVGLPGETAEDIKQIVDLSLQLAKLRKKSDGKIAQINAAISWFVPKAHTPFGWIGQKPKEYFEDAKRLILDEKRRLRANSVQFKFHHIERSILEAAIGTGDRRLGDVIEYAWRNGARFDLWNECFDYSLWQKAFEEFGMDMEAKAQKNFRTDQPLPWEHLGGPKKKHLLRHLKKAMPDVK